jgi:hypothetical protein
MTKKLMLLAAGALTALAFAALPAGASAEEMLSHCSATPCEGIVHSTGTAVLTDDAGSKIECTTTTGRVTQTAATSTTVNVILTFEGCNNDCQNEGHGTGRIATPTMVGHLITVTKGNPATAGILLTDVNITLKCTFTFVHKTITGNLIGTIPNPQCGVAATHHTLSFTQAASPLGTQADETYTGGTFDLLMNGTTMSLAGEEHINYGGGKKVTITC